jgi:hypothetical protein
MGAGHTDTRRGAIPVLGKQTPLLVSSRAIVSRPLRAHQPSSPRSVVSGCAVGRLRGVCPRHDLRGEMVTDARPILEFAGGFGRRLPSCKLRICEARASRGISSSWARGQLCGGILFCQTFSMTWPNHLQRTRPSRCGCNPRLPRAGSAATAGLGPSGRRLRGRTFYQVATFRLLNRISWEL